MSLFERGAVVTLASFMVLCAAAPLAAEDIHITPTGNGSGSEASPTNLAAALGRVAAGDRVVFHAGYYGDIVLGGRFDAATVFMAATSADVRLRSVIVRQSDNIVLRGFSISPSYAETYESGGTMITVGGDAPRTIVEDCELFAETDEVAAGWDEAAWAAATSGISLRTGDVTVRRNRLRNVGYGISVGYDAPDAVVVDNHIQNFSRDAFRGVGQRGRFESNVALDSINVDDHHDDFFQSWSYEDGEVGTSVVHDVVLRRNLFVATTDLERPFQPDAQGIGCFDGFFEGWIVENNVVIVDHWHGITFLGGRDMLIVNNTVLDNRPDGGYGPPWIAVEDHKDGRRSSGITIRNNLTHTLNLDADDSVADHNLRYAGDPHALFVDATGFDLHLRADASAAIDMGSSEGAPATDHDGTPRPQGAAIDLGAYEWFDPATLDAGVGPRDGGVTDGGAGDDAGARRDASVVDGGSAVDAGGPDAASEDEPSDADGCTCRSTRGFPPGALLFVFGFAGLSRRARRR